MIQRYFTLENLIFYYIALQAAGNFIFGLTYTDFGLGSGWGFASPLHELITLFKTKQYSKIHIYMLIAAWLFLPIPMILVHIFYNLISKILRYK